MKIGLDFDNTIISYGDIFHRCAVEAGLIVPTVPANKTAVRDEIRRRAGNDAWTQLQGLVYGVRISEALPTPGLETFLRRCVEARHDVCVVSFRTRYSQAGPRYDLHSAGARWLDAQPFYAQGLLERSSIHFEESLEAKLRRIGETGCMVFVDDLVENLIHPSFPRGIQRVLYGSRCSGLPADIAQCIDWPAVESVIFGTR